MNWSHCDDPLILQLGLFSLENFGQPENIGYGFQKNLGFFEPGPARHLGASREPDDLAFASFTDGLAEKRSHSNFRERGNAQDDNLEYLQSLRGLWERYQHQRAPSRAINFEDLSDEDVRYPVSIDLFLKHFFLLGR